MKPAIILVRPQLSENIGTAARAMLNNDLTDLRLVAPKPDWLSDRAIAAASGADRVVLACGMWARQLGLAVGVDLPLYPVEHHYVLS